MTDRPIIFSAPMVRALLDGRKGQTRRLVPQPPPECGINYMLGNESWMPAEQRTPVRRHFEAWHGPLFDNRPAGHLCGGFDIVPRIQPGDRLYVRENWRTLHKWDCLKPAQLADDLSKVTFEADPENRNPLWAFGKLRPCIHMPRWASRLTLTVTEVRVQRLQEIAEEDAKAEGVEYRDGCWGIWDADGSMRCGGTAYAWEAFRCLWLNIHGVGAWDANPWVVAVSFTVARGNIDQLARAA